MRPNLITRLKEERNNLDPVDPLRGLIADAIDALAEQPAQPIKQGWDVDTLLDKPKQPAQQDSETITQNFTGLPKRKLRDLLSAGWQINGVCFQRTEEDGTVRRGAATTGGMVLWWNSEQTAQQQEPYGWKVYGVNSLFMGEFAEADAKAEAKRIGGTCIAFPLYTSPQPASKPLTDEQIMEMYNEPRSDAEMITFARAIEAAHGISGEQA